MLASVFADIVCLGTCTILFLAPGTMEKGLWNVLFLGVITSAPVLATYTFIAFGLVNRKVEKPTVDKPEGDGSGESKRGQELQAMLITAAVAHVLAVVTSMAVALVMRLGYLCRGSDRAAVPHLCYFVLFMVVGAAVMIGWAVKWRGVTVVVSACAVVMALVCVGIVGNYAKMLSASLPWAS